MNPIYEKLFDSYCVQTLREVCPYDHESLEELLDGLSLDADVRLRLDDAFYERYRSSSGTRRLRKDNTC